MKKIKKIGLVRGRVSWDNPDIENLSCSYLIERGFHGRTIAKLTGLTVGQVYYRARLLGLGLRDYRDGESKVAASILDTVKLAKTFKNGVANKIVVSEAIRPKEKG